MRVFAVALATLVVAGTSAVAQTAPEARPRPPALVDAHTAIEKGVTNLCGWALAGEGYSLPAMQQTAFDAGYRRGASVSIVPLPEMRSQPSFSSLNFTAEIENAPAEGSGVVALVSFHNPVCQIQVYIYFDEAKAFVAGLPSSGWRLTAPEASFGNVAAQRWFGNLNGKPVTLVINRWVGEQMAPGNLGFILNVVPGEDPERGVLN